MASLHQIAEGSEFDATQAIRTIAKELYLLKSASGPTMAQPQADAAGNPLATLLNSRLASILTKGGLATIDAIKLASDEELLAVEGIDAKVLKLIREKLA
jgi:hypothetical protein